MKTPTLTPPKASSHSEPMNRPMAAPASTGFVHCWVTFWFTPVHAVGLHSVRVLAGLLFLAWALPFAGQVEAMFSLQGWLDQQGYLEASRLQEGAPMPISWSLFFLAGNNVGLVHVIYWAGLTAFALFALGIATRLTGLVSWLMVLSMMGNPATRFEGDYLLSILAFYLMIAYLLLGQWSENPTPLERILGSKDHWLIGAKGQGTSATSYAANLGLRLLQMHFALIMLTSALHKLQFGTWWSGVALWFPLHSPFTTTTADLQWAANHQESYRFVLSLAQYLVLGWQLAFPVFAWRQGKFRWLLLGGAGIGWLGSAFMYGLPVFGPAYLIFCLSYLTAEEWGQLKVFGLSLIGRNREIVRPSRTAGS